MIISPNLSIPITGNLIFGRKIKHFRASEQTIYNFFKQKCNNLIQIELILQKTHKKQMTIQPRSRDETDIQKILIFIIR